MFGCDCTTRYNVQNIRPTHFKLDYNNSKMIIICFDLIMRPERVHISKKRDQLLLHVGPNLLIVSTYEGTLKFPSYRSCYILQ